MQQTQTLQPAQQIRFNRFLASVYFIMTIGMVVTALVATLVSSNKEFMLRLVTSPWLAFGLFLVQIVLVTALSASVMRINPGIALLLFLLYSALTGLTLSSIFLYYSQTAIASAFWLAAGMFLLTSLVGFFIKTDLRPLGSFLMMALLGYLFGWIIVWFFPEISYAWNFMGILLFAGLTVWDTQRLRQLSTQLEGQQGAIGMAVLGALMLYLDFINLFLLILRTSRR